MECLQIAMQTLLPHNLSLIVEANFDRDLFSPCVQQLQQQFTFQIVQVQLKCEGEVLLARARLVALGGAP